MPFEIPAGAKLQPIEAIQGRPEVSVLGQLAAAFRRENTVAALLSLASKPDFEPVPGYDPVSEMTDEERLSAPWLAQAVSPDHLAWLREKKKQEEEALRQIDQGPLPSILVELTAGLIDPINLLPLSWARTPAKLALGVAGTVAASEAILHADQLTRTKAESIAAIAMGAGLGYGLGSIARLLGKYAEKQFDSAVKDMAAVIAKSADELTSLAPGTLSAARTGFISDITPEATKPLAASIGPIVQKLGDWGLFSPGAALAFSEDPLVRRLAHQLVDTGVFTEGQAKGVTFGIPLDTRIRARKAMFQMAFQDIVESGFADFRRVSGKPEATREQFFEEVFLALRQGDVHTDPIVEKTARALRERILAPLGKEAQELGLIPKLLYGPEGVNPGVAGYVPQRLLAHKINARLADFKARMTRHIAQQIEEINQKVLRAKEERAAVDELKAQLNEVNAKLKMAREGGAEGAKRIGPVVKPLTEQQKVKLQQLREKAQTELTTIRSQIEELEKFNAARGEIEAKIKEIDDQLAKAEQRRQEIYRNRDAVMELRYSESIARTEQGIKDLEAYIEEYKKRLLEAPPEKKPEYKAAIERAKQTIKANKEVLRSLQRKVRDHEKIFKRNENEVDTKVGRLQKQREKLVKQLEALTPPKIEGDVDQLRARVGELEQRIQEIDQAFERGLETIDTEDVASIRAITLDERLVKAELTKARGRVEEITARIARRERHLEQLREQKAKLEAKAAEVEAKAAEGDPIAVSTKKAIKVSYDALTRSEQRVAAEIEKLKKELPLAEKAVKAAEREFAELVRRTDAELAPKQAEAAKAVEEARKEAAKLEAQRQLIWLDLKMWREERATAMRLRGSTDPAEWDPTGLIRAKIAEAEKRLKEHTQLQKAHRAKYRQAIKEARALRAIPRDELAKLEAERARLEELIKAREEIAREAERLAGDLEEFDPAEAATVVDDFITRLNKTDYSRFQEFRVKFGNLKERSIDVPPDILRDYGDTDVFNVLSSYINGVVTDIETQKMFGWLDPPEGSLDNPFEEIMRSAQARAAQETDPDKARAIIERAAKDVDTLQELLRRVRGTNASRIPPSMLGLSRAAEQARNWNFMRLMGSSVLSSLPDFARVASANGWARTLGFVIKDMTSFFKTTRLAKAQARKLGIAIETVLNHRTRVTESLDETYRGRTKIEAFLSKRMTPTIAYLTLQPQWTDAMKAIDSVLTVDHLLSIAEDIAAGKIIAPARMRDLTTAGLDATWAKKIVQIKEAWVNVDGLKQLDIDKVREVDPDLADQTIFGLHQAINDTVISPGVGDIPAWMDRNDLGRSVSQFKRWVIAGQTRILVRLVQHAAAKEYATVAAHLAGLVTFGMIATALRDITADGQVDFSRNAREWVWSGIDRAGVLGLFSELDAMVGMTTGWNAARLIGGAQLSRYRERTALDQALGPTAGLIDDTLKAIMRLTDGSIDLKDLQALRRLAPLQNWFLTNYLLDVVTGKQAKDDERKAKNEARLTRSAMP